MIKFNLHNVTNTETKMKARVFYSLDNHISGRPCVTLYAKSPLDKLRSIFDHAENNSDIMTDYFESDRVRFFEGDEGYDAARKTAERLQEKRAA